MVEPMTVIEIATKTYKVIEFVVEIVTDTIEVYKSPDGTTKPDAHMGDLENDLTHVTNDLAKLLPAPNTEDSRNLNKQSKHASAIVDLAKKAKKKCEELWKELDKLKVSNGTRWRVAKSFGVVAKSLWKRKDITSIHADLQEYRSALVLRLTMLQIQSEENHNLNHTLTTALDNFARRTRSKHEVEWRVCQRIQNALYFENLHDREDRIAKADKKTLRWLFDDGDYGSTDEEEHSDDVWTDDVYSENEYSENENDDGESDREYNNCDDPPTESYKRKAKLDYESWLCGQILTDDTQSDGGDDGCTVTKCPNILHISGKAGSGKSTLMRFVSSHEKTAHGLLQWAGDCTLVRAKYYFWAVSSDTLQNSLEGLFKTVLYEILGQCPELGAYLFPRQWLHIQSQVELRIDDAHNHADGDIFRPKHITDAFSRLVGIGGVANNRYRVCLFLDGLDEYTGEKDVYGKQSKVSVADFKSLAAEITRWSKSDHIKICTSARPYPDFVQKFSQDNALAIHLHKLNQNDIRLYCQQKFESNGDIKGYAESFTETARLIAERSDGVFLWAYYTVGTMVNSYELDDSETMRKKKLDAIQPSLEALYDHMFNQIPESERRRSNAVLQLLLRLPDDYRGLPTGVFLWIDELLDDPEFPTMDEYFPPYDDTELEKKLAVAEKRMSLWTGGLLVRLGEGYRTEYGPFHRSAIDFLRKLDSAGKIPNASGFADSNMFGRLTLAEVIYFGKRIHPEVVSTCQGKGDFVQMAFKLAGVLEKTLKSYPPTSDLHELVTLNSGRNRLCIFSYKYIRKPTQMAFSLSNTGPFDILEGLEGCAELMLSPLSFIVALMVGNKNYDLGPSAPELAARNWIPIPDIITLLPFLAAGDSAVFEGLIGVAKGPSLREFLDSTEPISGQPWWVIIMCIFITSHTPLDTSQVRLTLESILPEHVGPDFDYHLFVQEKSIPNTLLFFVR